MIEGLKKTRAAYRYHSDEEWLLIRARYLKGESARALAEAFKATEWAIRARIRRGGWTKRALAEARGQAIVEAMTAPDMAGERVVPDLEPSEPMEPREAVRVAVNTAVQWMREGKLGQAAEAARLADVLGRAVGRLEAGVGPVEDEAVEAAAFEAVRRKVLGMVDEVDPSTAALSPSPRCEEDRTVDEAGLCFRHPPASAARPGEPAACENTTLSQAPTSDATRLNRSPSAPLGPLVCAADAAGRRMTTGKNEEAAP